MKTLKIDRFLKLIDESYRQLDEVLSRLDSEIVCEKGCHWCCERTGIYADLVECLAIVCFLNERDRNTMIKIATAIEDFNLYYDIYVGRGPKSFKTPEQAMAFIDRLNFRCPFLDHNVCSIYPVRPLFCRAYISYSVDECIEGSIPVAIKNERVLRFLFEKREYLRSLTKDLLFAVDEGSLYYSEYTDQHFIIPPRLIKLNPAKQKFVLSLASGVEILPFRKKSLLF